MKYSRLGSENLRNGGQWAYWPLEPVSRIWIRRAATSASSSCWVGAGRGAEARFPTPPAEPCMPLSGHTALPLSVILSLDLRLRRFCISPMSIGTFPYVLDQLPLHWHSRQTAALRSPRLSPGSSLLWRHRLPSKASMAHSPNHPSTGLQRSCLLTPTVWFRRRVPIDPIRSLRNPDHPGGNPGQSPAPAHRACFVWPATQVRATMVAIPVPCGTTGQPV